MQTNIVIAVDLDNVIAETDPKIREILKILSGLSLSQDDILSFEYSNALIAKGVEPLTARKLEEDALKIFHGEECCHVNPIQGALEGLSRLAKAGMSLVIVTSRPVTCEHLTRIWLNDHDIFFTELLFVKEKVKYAHNWSFLVEDAAHHAKAVAEMGIPVCLLDYPWNTIISHPLIRRAKYWREIVEILFSTFAKFRTEGAQ